MPHKNNQLLDFSLFSIFLSGSGTNVVIVHASFRHYLDSERSAAVQHLKNLEDLNIYQDSVIIFDRGYYSEKMFRYCVEHQHICLMRLKECYRFAKNCHGDMIDILPGNKKKGTKDINIRVIEVLLDNGTKEYLATNLFDPSITPTMFQELYFYRWPVEGKYKELKTQLALEEFSGATTVSVFQEFYINLLFSNLSSLIKNQADEEIKISAKSTNKYRYQANRFVLIITLWYSFLSCFYLFHLQKFNVLTNLSQH